MFKCLKNYISLIFLKPDIQSAELCSFPLSLCFRGHKEQEILTLMFSSRWMMYKYSLPEINICDKNEKNYPNILAMCSDYKTSLNVILKYRLRFWPANSLWTIRVTSNPERMGSVHTGTWYSRKSTSLEDRDPSFSPILPLSKYQSSASTSQNDGGGHVHLQSPLQLSTLWLFLLGVSVTTRIGR